VVASVDGPSDIDTAHDAKRYRYFAAGALHRAMMRAKVRERLPWVTWRQANAASTELFVPVERELFAPFVASAIAFAAVLPGGPPRRTSRWQRRRDRMLRARV
jgi:hypothetical protein